MVPNRPTTLTMAIRLLVGLIWLAGAVVNLFWTLRHPSVITDSLSADATFHVYRWLFGEVVGWAPLRGIALLIAGELALGLLVLSKERLTRAGLAGSAIFSTFLFFVIWPYTLIMAAFALFSVWPLRYSHPVSLPELIRRGSAAFSRSGA